MKQLVRIIHTIAVLIVLLSFMVILFWLDVAKAWVDHVPESYVFATPVNMTTWWGLFITGFGPLSVIVWLYYHDYLPLNTPS